MVIVLESGFVLYRQTISDEYAPMMMKSHVKRTMRKCQLPYKKQGKKGLKAYEASMKFAKDGVELASCKNITDELAFL